MSALFQMPNQPAFGVAGQFAPGAKLFFYASGTSSLVDIEDSDGNSLPNPIQADASGRFAAIYLNPLNDYRVVLKTSSDSLIDEIDPYNSPASDAAAYAADASDSADTASAQATVATAQAAAATALNTTPAQVAAMQTAISALTVGSSIAVKKTTKALLDADLAWAANSLGLVYADSTVTNNDLYVKSGASGSGSWSATGLMTTAAQAASLSVSRIVETTATAVTATNWTLALNAGHAISGTRQQFAFDAPVNSDAAGLSLSIPGIYGATTGTPAYFPVLLPSGDPLPAKAIRQAYPVRVRPANIGGNNRYVLEDPSYAPPSGLAFLEQTNASGQNIIAKTKWRQMNTPADAYYQSYMVKATAAASGGAKSLKLLDTDSNTIVDTLNLRELDNTEISGTRWNAGDFLTIIRNPATTAFNLVRVDSVPSSGSNVSSQIPSALARMEHVVVYGQSNAERNGGFPALDTNALDAGRTFMFNSGPLPGDNTSSYVITDDRLASIVNLKDGTLDGYGTIMPRIARKLSAAMPVYTGIFVSGHAVGGRTIAQLAKGSNAWSNKSRAMAVLSRAAQLSGVFSSTLCMAWVQGEADSATSKATYLTALNTMQSDFRDEARDLSGSATLDPPILIAQPSSWTVYNTATSAVPDAQMQAMLDNPTKFAVVCPLYPFSYNTGESPIQHLDNLGKRLLGEYYDRAMTAWKASGSLVSAQGLYIASASRSGTTVTVTVHNPSGTSLAIDTTLVTDPGQRGLVYRDGSNNSIAISSVTMVNATTFTFTLASAVAGTLSAGMEGTPLNNAGPTTGPRCNIRDTNTDTSAAGTPMYNWMCHCKVSVA